MVIEVVYEKGLLRPIVPLLDIAEGEKLDVEIVPGGSHWRGALKDLKLTSVQLQNKGKDYWSEKYVSN